jgi:Zn-dependent M16 (insulinase) family peptidase
MQILCELVNEAFLHTEIREKGGAYGRFSSHDRNGIFSLGSIRDPQCLRTVDVFKRALVWLANTDVKESATKENSTQPGFNYTQQQLDEAKMALFASIDAPQSAGNRGLSPWLRNAEHSHRKALRASILNTTLDDIQRCARKHLNFDNALISVVGNQEKVPAEITDASNDPTGIWTLTLLDMEIDPDAAIGGEDGDDEGDDE